MFKTLMIATTAIAIAACSGVPECNTFCQEQSTLPEIIYFDDDGNEIGREDRIGGFSLLTADANK